MDDQLEGVRYRILLVAPDVGLPDMAREVSAIASQHDVTLLLGDVTENDLRREASRGGYDIIWFVTHSDGQCIMLRKAGGGTEGVCGADLASYVAASGAELCVLNTCQSVNIALRILQSSSADVICTVADPTSAQTGVLDKEAMSTGVLFAGRLTVSGSYRSAYETSKPGDNRTYLYLDNGNRMAAQLSAQNSGGSDDPLSARSMLIAQLNRMEQSIGEMRAAQGRTNTDIAVLQRELDTGLKNIGDRIDRVEKTAANGNSNGSIPLRGRDWVIIFLAVAASVVASFTVYAASAGAGR
jgi:hypothetical protein